MRTPFRSPTLLLAFVPALAACAGRAVPEAFPQDVADAWLERYRADDAAGVAALYTEDAQLLPPDAPVVSGRTEIREFIARNFRPGGAQVEVVTVETRMFGDYAHRQGSFKLGGPGRDSGATGKFLELWKKVDGRWLIHREIWNSNAPSPAFAADAKTDEPA